MALSPNGAQQNGEASRPEAETVEASAPTTKAGGAPSLLRDRFLVFPGTRLAELDCPTAKAYLAQDRRDTERQLFALIIPPGLPPRTHRADELKGMGGVPGLLPLVEWGIIDWPPIGQRCTALVYERPRGGRVMDARETAHGLQNIRELQKTYLEPIVAGIRELALIGLPHRSIRPDNLFFMDADQTRIVLGDCISVPPGYDQPIAFETIERAMCSRAGRGAGDTQDDMYALGVTLVFLLLGGNPVANLSGADLIEAKIHDGTYAVLCGNERIPVNLLEPVRGLLSDDPDERWGLEELDLWIDGRRMSPIQRKAVKKTDRPFKFGGREYDNVRSLAQAFFRKSDAAARTIREGQVEMWIRRNIEDPDRAAMIGALVKDAEEAEAAGRYNDDVLVAQACAFLDAKAPIRYKGLAFMPDGLGPLLAAEAVGRGDPQVIIECINRDIPMIWFGLQDTPHPIQKRVEIMRTWLRNADPGFGLERCLYELNNTLPCQSSLLAGQHVSDMRDLLRALDAVARSVEANTKPIDRHIAAFIASRFDQNAEPHINALASASEERALLGMLSLLALIQWRTGLDALYGLAGWIGGMMGPALRIYHSNSARRDLEREIPKLVRKGSLPELINLIENPDALGRDHAGFEAAKREFAAAEDQIQTIESQRLRRESTEEAAKQIAAIASIVFTLVAIVGIYMMKNWHGH